MHCASQLVIAVLCNTLQASWHRGCRDAAALRIWSCANDSYNLCNGMPLHQKCYHKRYLSGLWCQVLRTNPRLYNCMIRSNMKHSWPIPCTLHDPFACNLLKNASRTLSCQGGKSSCLVRVFSCGPSSSRYFYQSIVSWFMWSLSSPLHVHWATSAQLCVMDQSKKLPS